MFQHALSFDSGGRGTLDITREVAEVARASGIERGLCHVFIQHTSASLIICENVDPSVRRDVERFAARLAPDGDPDYEHDTEGPDDMAAHLRSIVSGASLLVPVVDGRLALGTWQGLYLWEHRHASKRRHLVVSVWE